MTGCARPSPFTPSAPRSGRPRHRGLLVAGGAAGQGEADTDGDGVSDAVEAGLGTDPLDSDTDDESEYRAGAVA